MQRAMLCEGKTDAILASYMLGKLYGWEFSSALSLSPAIKLPVDRKNECLNWYAREGNHLAIWGVGGYNELPAKLAKIIERTRSEMEPDRRFSRVAIVCDRDDRTEAQCTSDVLNWLADSEVGLSGSFAPGQWLNATVESSDLTPATQYQMEILVVTIPPDSRGALETFLLQALRETDGDLIDEAEGFIDNVPDTPYLTRQRLRPKACLGAVLSVMSPDWVFSEIDDRLTRVPWEELAAVCQVWDALGHL